jgi:hypothetical protein
MTNIVDWTWTKKSQTLAAILDRGARISDELLAVAEAAQQRLAGIPDDNSSNEDSHPAAVA